MMGAQLMHHAYEREIPKFIALGTVCAYPKFSPIPFREEDLWNGYPDETNAPYGLAKKMMLVQSDSYRQEYGYNSIFLLLVNVYGPRDNFDLDTSHVIPAVIRKCVEAVETGAKEILVWGDGSPTREFLYVEDAVEGIAAAAQKYDAVTGFHGQITWDSTKPNGQPTRKLDVTKAQAEFGFRSRTTFESGLRATVDWYRRHRGS
jgi:GDP-L-fucose synthase